MMPLSFILVLPATRATGDLASSRFPDLSEIRVVAGRGRVGWGGVLAMAVHTNQRLGSETPGAGFGLRRSSI